MAGCRRGSRVRAFSFDSQLIGSQSKFTSIGSVTKQVKQIFHDQKEGNGNLDIIFALFRRDNRFTSAIFHHDGIEGDTYGQNAVACRDMTYSNNGRIIGHGRSFCLLEAGMLFDSQILHIAATKDNILVDLVRGSYLFCWPASASFCAEGPDIFQGYRRLIRIDFMESANVAEMRISRLRN